MSLPLWEECAWYVDVPEPEAVHDWNEHDANPEGGDWDYYGEDENHLYEEGFTSHEDGNEDICVDINDNAEIYPEEGLVAADEPHFAEQVDMETAHAAKDEEPVDGHDAHDEVDKALCDDQPTQNLDEVHVDGLQGEEQPVGTADVPTETAAGEDEGEHTVEQGTEEEHNNNEEAVDGEELEMYDVAVDIVEEPEDVPAPSPYKFQISRSINKRMYLYLGEIFKLPCDAIVVGQVESLSDRLDGNDTIFTLAGPELEPELMQLAPCTTGDSVITHGYHMPCEWIIHAVGPKYDERYLNASDHALFSAYKSALLLAAEKEVQSLVIGTVYKASKKYPRFDAAHVALRTVRKFLEHSVGDTFQRVMFCVNTQEDFEIYSALMHAYFPRNQDELEDQLNLLPIELGDEWGEIIIPDRVVKVSVGPKPLPVESLQQYKASEEVKVDKCGTPASGSGKGKEGYSGKKLGIRDIKAVGEGPRSMTYVEHDPDYERRRKIQAEFAQMTREERLRLRFQAMVRDLADEEDLDELDALKLIHFLGKDFKERTVVYLSGANLMRAESMDHGRVLRYLLKRMEPLRCVPFVLIYGCATLGDDRYPDTNFMQSIFDLYACRYNDTLMKFYIMHASFSFRMYFWLLLPLETTTFWSSYTNLTSIRSLRHYMDIPSLDIPSDLLRYDQEHYSS